MKAERVTKHLTVMITPSQAARLDAAVSRTDDRDRSYVIRYLIDHFLDQVSSQPLPTPIGKPAPAAAREPQPVQASETTLPTPEAVKTAPDTIQPVPPASVIGVSIVEPELSDEMVEAVRALAASKLAEPAEPEAVSGLQL